jgi:ribulose 1,5-bisphosphate carboxylase large subunit-like protein
MYQSNLMTTESIWTVLITLITVLGSTSAWKFYEKRADSKRDDDNFIKQDCRDRIAKLEALLVESSNEKDKMRETILNLTEKVSALTVKVEFLQKENAELINRLTKN